MDKILLKGMRFHAFVGATEAERQQAQTIEVDLELWLPSLRDAGQRDDLRATLDYGRAFEATRAVVEGQRANLLEHLAERIAEAVKPLGAKEVVVRVRKFRPPVDGMVEAAEVEVWR
jgi:dihydroneopterin aldolase